MDILAIIISFVSLVVSIVVARIYYKANVQASNLNKINLESKYYEEIFKEYLLKKIPEARRYIKFNNIEKRQLSPKYKELTGILTSMRRDILYFYYRKKDFYNELNEKLVDIDDHIVRIAGKKGVPFTEEQKFMDDLDSKINDLYKCIFDNYLGS